MYIVLLKDLYQKHKPGYENTKTYLQSIYSYATYNNFGI
jgi:hypothetical protein